MNKTTPISKSPKFCSSCGRELGEYIREYIGRSYDITTGTLLKEGRKVTVRVCPVYYPINHDVWELTEGDLNWIMYY